MADIGQFLDKKWEDKELAELADVPVDAIQGALPLALGVVAVAAKLTGDRRGPPTGGDPNPAPAAVVRARCGGGRKRPPPHRLPWPVLRVELQ